MVDVTPYIIVDNKRISPVGWSTPSGSASEKKKEGGEQEFGIVDRVTISKEARDKFRLFQDEMGDEPAAVVGPPDKPAISIRSLLTYSPKQKI